MGGQQHRQQQRRMKETHLEQLIVLDAVHPDVRVDGRWDRVAGIDGRVLRDRDVNDRRGEKGGVVIYILD